MTRPDPIPRPALSRLSPLPPELVALIISPSFLDPPHLALCARVNSVFYAIAVIGLYRSVILDRDWRKAQDADWDDEEDDEDFGGAKWTGPASQPFTTITRIQHNPNPDPHLDLKSPMTSRALAMGSAVRTLVIDSHHPANCDPLPPLPHLEVLVLCLRGLHGPRSFHNSIFKPSIHDYPLLRTVEGSGSAPCRYLTSLQPRVLVVRGVPVLYERLSASIQSIPSLSRLSWSSPPYASPTLSTVERFLALLEPDVALVGANHKTESPGCGAAGLWGSVPPSAKEVVLVFYTTEMGGEWRPRPRPTWTPAQGHVDARWEGVQILEGQGQGEGQRRGRGGGGGRDEQVGEGNIVELPSWAGSWVGRFCADLAEAVSPWIKDKTNRLSIVNAGSIDRFAVDCTDRWTERGADPGGGKNVSVKVQARVEEWFFTCLDRKLAAQSRQVADGEKGMREIKARVEFVTMEKWRRYKEWKDVLADPSAKVWL